MSQKPNGIASAADFKNAASAANPPERIVLPKSGFAVLLRRPTAFGIWMLDQRLVELQEKIEARDLSLGPAPAGPQAQASSPWSEWRDLMRKAIEDAVVQPKLSLTPGRNEIHPDWLPQEDQIFLVRWVRGLIAPDGTDLVEKFFRERRRSEIAATASGAGGRDAALPAVELARADGPLCPES